MDRRKPWRAKRAKVQRGDVEDADGGEDGGGIDMNAGADVEESRAHIGGNGEQPPPLCKASATSPLVLLHTGDETTAIT